MDKYTTDTGNTLRIPETHYTLAACHGPPRPGDRRGGTNTLFQNTLQKIIASSRTENEGPGRTGQGAQGRGRGADTSRRAGLIPTYHETCQRGEGHINSTTLWTPTQTNETGLDRKRRCQRGEGDLSTPQRPGSTTPWLHNAGRGTSRRGVDTSRRAGLIPAYHGTCRRGEGPINSTALAPRRGEGGPPGAELIPRAERG